jgi:L-alanine-DL-glutamate epimerase-like enolase superfamily enzyme
MTRLQVFGIRARAGRNTTLMDLAAQIPAVVLTKLLGIGINTATSWTQQAQTGAAYAAEVARRQHRNTSH